MGAGWPGDGAQIDAIGLLAVAEFQWRLGAAGDGERVADPSTLALDLDGRCCVCAFRRSTVDADVDVGFLRRIEELQATLVDPDFAEARFVSAWLAEYRPVKKVPAPTTSLALTTTPAPATATPAASAIKTCCGNCAQCRRHHSIA